MPAPAHLLRIKHRRYQKERRFFEFTPSSFSPPLRAAFWITLRDAPPTEYPSRLFAALCSNMGSGGQSYDESEAVIAHDAAHHSPFRRS